MEKKLKVEFRSFQSSSTPFGLIARRPKAVPASKDSKSIARSIGMQKVLEPERVMPTVELGVGSKIDVTAFRDRVEY